MQVGPENCLFARATAWQRRLASLTSVWAPVRAPVEVGAGVVGAIAYVCYTSGTRVVD